MHPGAEDVYGEGQLLSVIDRIRAFVRDDSPVAEDVQAVKTYINRGVSQFEALLNRHAEFDAWCAERGIA